MPNNTVYGGLEVYPSTPFLIDKVYSNRAAMDSNCAIDGIFVGRYVMIRYCNDNFDQETKRMLHWQVTEGYVSINEDGTVNVTNSNPQIAEGSDMQVYLGSYMVDLETYENSLQSNVYSASSYSSYDHTIWRKELNEFNEPYYAPIGRTDISYAPNNVAFDENTFAGQILSEHEDENGVIAFAEIFNVYPEWEKKSDGSWGQVQQKANYAEGAGAHAEGFMTKAKGIGAHAEGKQGVAEGEGAHVEGCSDAEALTSMDYSAWIENKDTIHARGTGAHAEGVNTWAGSSGAHAEGVSSAATGQASHAEGYQTTASGDYSHTEGEGTVAEGSYSHAEGYTSYAKGQSSHAEGNSTAEGDCSHAEGYSKAGGEYSHAEGSETFASGINSHAGGLGTVADQENQTAIGKYNTEGNINSLFVVGNGDSEGERSDAFVVYDDGHAELNNNGTMERIATEAYVQKHGVELFTNPNDITGKILVDLSSVTPYENGGKIYPGIKISFNEIHNALPAGSMLMWVPQTELQGWKGKDSNKSDTIVYLFKEMEYNIPAFPIQIGQYGAMLTVTKGSSYRSKFEYTKVSDPTRTSGNISTFKCYEGQIAAFGPDSNVTKIWSGWNQVASNGAISECSKSNSTGYIIY